MNSCMRKGYDTEKITGSGFCLKHWIDQRYFLVIAGAWISGVMIVSFEYLFRWLGIGFMLFTGYMYYSIGKDVNDLQNHIYEYEVKPTNVD